MWRGWRTRAHLRLRLRQLGDRLLQAAAVIGKEFAEPILRQVLRATGRAALTRFWHEEEASGTKPTHVEREFGFTLGTDRVRGRWDRVDETGDGPVIVDYKSSDVREPARAEDPTHLRLERS